MRHINTDYGIKVTGPDGTVFFLSAAQLGTVYDCILGAGTTPVTATINPGDAVIVFNSTEAGADTELILWDGTNPGGVAGTTEAVSVRPTASAASVGFLGVALDKAVLTAATNTQRYVRVAGIGSLIAVNSVASGSITSNTIGAGVQGSGTANKVNAIVTAPAVGTILGQVMKIAGTTAATTGSDTMLGVLVTSRGGL